METELATLLANAVQSGVQQKQLREITKVNTKSTPKYLAQPKNYKQYFYITAIIAVLLTVGLPSRAFKTPVKYLYQSFYSTVYDPEGTCLVSSGQMTFDIVRPIVSCDICKGMTDKVEMICGRSKEA